MDAVEALEKRGRARPELARPWVESPFFEEELEARGATAEQRDIAERFRRDGYVVLPGAVDAALVDRVVAEMDQLYEEGTRVVTQRVMDAWDTCPGIRELAIQPQILEVVEFLYGRRAVPFQTLNFRQGSQQRGHADSMLFHSLPPRFMCGSWVALEDIGPEAGPLFYYPGSHTLPELNPYDLDMTVNAFKFWLYEDFEEDLMESLGMEAQPFCANKGDVLLWSSNIVHGGTPIIEPGSTRKSQVTHIHFEDCVYYSPMRSNSISGELYLRPAMTDIRTGQKVHPRWNGRPVSARERWSGRSTLTIEPTPVRRVVDAVVSAPPRLVNRTREALHRWRHGPEHDD